MESVSADFNGGDPERDRARWLDFAQTRSRLLRDELVQRYLGLAKMTAARLYQKRGDNSVPFSDYLQYARMGLMEAIDSFEPERAVPFEAFSSFRIKGAVLNGLASESELAAQRAFWSRRARERFESIKQHEVQNDRRASLEELVNLTVGLALSHVIEHDDGEVIDETLAANPYAVTELVQLKRAVRSLLPALPERERELIRRHYEEHVEFQQIAMEWGLTKGRVSQLHAQALKRLRQMLGLRPSLDKTL
ncbi:MAG TPA: sigma-70 family RNA polymerase sigma factor [Steroidobacteraceae bacterium]|jgi:RNA polymerase sigma factor for flagellar operon FliA|nr:sigma-70 family RNA polymerase sigma factor [Steroidobacteraceae bacterium]